MLWLADRGVSRQLLDALQPLAGWLKLPGPAVIWDRIQHLAQAGNNAPGATLVKRVSGPEGEVAYKLHDYVSGLLQQYLQARHMAQQEQRVPGANEGDEVDNLLQHAQEIVLRIAAYFYRRGNHFKELLGESAHADPADRELLPLLTLYQAHRSDLVYYALRLAALRHRDGVSEDVHPGPQGTSGGPPFAQPKVLLQAGSARLASALGIVDPDNPRLPDSSPAILTYAILSYVYGKVVREKFASICSLALPRCSCRTCATTSMINSRGAN